MKSLRETLAASHISAIAIAVLIFYSVDLIVRALLWVLPVALNFVATAIAVRGMPYVSPRSSLMDQLSVTPALFALCAGFITLAAAWLLSWWVYRAGLFAALSRHRPVLGRRNHV